MRVKTLAQAIAAIGLLGSGFAHAADDNQLERVTITGSNIKRSIKQEKALPVTILKTEELAKQGLTTVEQVVNSIAANQSTQGSSYSVGASTGGGSFASLRGLGNQYTLVLLDGRRMANQAIDGTSADLNAIPLSVIDRVEVLLDGASAIYGTDAIGGVMNFITKKSMKGFSIGGSFANPQHGGGDEKRVNASYGIGDLAKDGFNVYGAVDYLKQDMIMASQRGFASTITPQTDTVPSVNAWPGSYYDSVKKKYVQPSAPNCRPPYSQFVNGRCREYFPLYPSIVPEVEQISGVFKATKRIGDDHELSLQYTRTETITTAQNAPLPTAGDVTRANLTDPSQRDQLYVRAVPLGNRETEANSVTQRLMLNLEGLVAGWDYRAGIGRSENLIKENLTSGYISKSKMQSAIDSGALDPFDLSGNNLAAWRSVSMTGQTKEAKSTIDMADAKVSKELFDLPAGKLGVALGAEVRHESLSTIYNKSVTRDALSTGQDKTEDSMGSRSAYAFYGEADIPVLKTLDVQLAARYDHYSDTESSLNPKVAFKFQPDPKVMFRGSASTGFRAPSLYNIYRPNQLQLTGKPFKDTGACVNGAPLPGTNGDACTEMQRNKRIAGNKNLQPEKSSSLSFGMVIEPAKDFTASADLWWTMIKDQISVLDESLIINNPALYADRYVRDANGNLSYLVDDYSNLGNLSASGVDLRLSWILPKTSFGVFTAGLDGTYLAKYEYQREKNGDYFSNLGTFKDGGPTFRWQHNLTLNWMYGPWSAILSQNYKSGYTDENPKKENHLVKPYSTWNLSASYAWNKQLTFTAGVKNLFDQEPPFSNQQTRTTQMNYDPRLADPTGRSFFLKGAYKM
ncbi:TonB-dependent receptor plug domain-containing protein [Chromobacterium violaceum]|uniref:Colicin I receptor n=1 Tax=Chromobacterium violaceum TaxID=536 RepID=A0AAX2ME45_CHRVL|nr:TonB-dependent receptor [Chromobacterium violaceum]STB70264.1 Colicin I receptor precursor [Chromobacterium violaceum]SUX34909.1 Colicin I receptor precursor [Chromobacterium violaceum]